MKCNSDEINLSNLKHSAGSSILCPTLQQKPTDVNASTIPAIQSTKTGSASSRKFLPGRKIGMHCCWLIVIVTAGKVLCLQNVCCSLLVKSSRSWRQPVQSPVVPQLHKSINGHSCTPPGWMTECQKERGKNHPRCTLTWLYSTINS